LTDTQLLAGYPASSFSGVSVTTTDMGLEISDGVSWNIQSPPVPPGAAALGYTKCLFIFHPTVARLNVSGSGASGAYQLYGSPGNGGTQTSAMYTTTNGQFTLVNSGTSSVFPACAAVTQNSTSLATLQGLLPLIPVSTAAGYYAECAYHINNNNADHWESPWIWTAEQNTGATTQWIEYDITEDGTQSAGMFSTAHYWNGGTNNQSYVQSNLYNGANLDKTVEHIYGGSFDPVGQTFQRWLDGSSSGVWGSFTGSPPGSTPFSAISLPTAAYNGFHHFITMDAASHGANVPYNMMIRYWAVWVHP
jgi:hypothetical protein